MLRIGQGYDIHRLVEGRPLLLGGYRIPDATLGLLGHSDADALVHAVIDAILGALALGDIGRWFPDTDPQWRGAAGETLLRRVLADERVRPWRLVNLDSTVITQTPRLAPHIDAIRDRLAQLLDVPPAAVSVKAKAHERLDDIGAGLALEAHAVVLMERATPSSSPR